MAASDGWSTIEDLIEQVNRTRSEDEHDVDEGKNTGPFAKTAATCAGQNAAG